MMPWRDTYSPVKIDARLSAQIGVVTYAFRNSTPFWAMASSVGVLTIGFPTALSASQRMSSASRKMMFGRSRAMKCGPGIRWASGTLWGTPSGEEQAARDETAATRAAEKQRATVQRRTIWGIATLRLSTTGRG